MDCSAFIQSEETIDLIVARDEREEPMIEPVCVQPIDERYEVWYYDGTQLPPLSVERYSYTSIPKVFWLMDSSSLEVSGILALQNQPTLALRGKGVLVGIVDTGIDYTNPLFRNVDGSTRIHSIWDQTGVRRVQDEMTDDGALTPQEDKDFKYGIIYKREQINEALSSENPLEVVPQMDENGHGTFLASVAAGGEDSENDFIGAAPDSELVVVKLKTAKRNLRDYFYFSAEEPLYQENDIMAGIAYLEYVARKENRPLVVLIGLGSNQGSRTGSGPLSEYMGDIGITRGRAVVVAAGNEAASQHHFYGEAKSLLTPVSVEINVAEGVEGFCMELWSYAPELVRVVVQSPTGQQSQGGFPVTEETQTTNYIFENTLLTINYRVAGRRYGDLLVFFRFTAPSPGIWTVQVFPVNAITGAFHMWLPIQSQISSGVRFIRPNPDTTITTPSAAEIPITVGGYNGLTGAIDIRSGRGFGGLGQVKPEFCAPSVNVFGAGLRNLNITYTGTSAAAAITAGAAAQVLEWGILRGNAPAMNTVEVKNLLIRGCQRDDDMVFPNEAWGYGALNAYQSFERLRE